MTAQVMMLTDGCAQVKGRMAGVLSAKGGCGATTVACHLAAALRLENGMGKVLVADLDSQAPAAHRIFRVTPERRVSPAFDSVRRLNTASLLARSSLATEASQGLDLLAGFEMASGAGLPLPEPWRIESMFRFLREITAGFWRIWGEILTRQFGRLSRIWMS